LRYLSDKLREPIMEEPPVELTTNEARGGYTPHIARYVLAISLGVTVVLFAVIVIAWSF